MGFESKNTAKEEIILPKVNPYPDEKVKITKNTWIFRFLPPGIECITIYPNIFTKLDVDKVPVELVEHEKVHYFRQKEMGVWSWIWKYQTDRKFKYIEEILGYRRQLEVVSKDNPDLRIPKARDYANLLYSAYGQYRLPADIQEDLLK